MTSNQNDLTLMRVVDPSPWPPDDMVSSIIREPGGRAIAMTYWPDGRLGVQVLAPDGTEMANGTTQPIDFVGSGKAVLTITCGEGILRIRMNGIELKSWHESPVDRATILLSGGVYDPRPAYQHPDVDACCRNWIANRARYSAKISRRPGERPVSLNEDIEALQLASRALAEYADALLGGEAQHRASLSGQIRALVVNLPGPNYNPLLQRVAARTQAPLPVYAIRDTPLGSGLPAPEYEVAGESVGTFRTTSAHVLMDLDEWLAQEAHRASVGGNTKRQTNAAFLAEVAHKLGGAHYDPTRPIVLDARRESQVQGVSSVDRFLVDVARVIAELTNYVVTCSMDSQRASQ